MKEERAPQQDGSPKIPVTIITGYLGAGKTTLLKRIIDSVARDRPENAKRLAIVMNEFGEIAIDSKIVEGKGIRIAELAGGCVCCSLSGEFGAAVAELISSARPERIVVETTGVAEPAALAYDIKENIPGIRLDSIVTIVDADSMARFPSLGHTGREQIELADLLVLNKTDLVGSEPLANAIRALESLNPRAAIIETEKCEVATEMLFGIGHGAPITKHKTHSIGFESFGYVSDAPMGHDAFIQAAGKLPKGIYRAKGFVKTEKGDFLFDFVAGRWSLETFGCERTELVFIGNIDKGSKAAEDAVRALLDEARAAIGSD